jgi:hypothetical protein
MGSPATPVADPERAKIGLVVLAGVEIPHPSVSIETDDRRPAGYIKRKKTPLAPRQERFDRRDDRPSIDREKRLVMSGGIDGDGDLGAGRRSRERAQQGQVDLRDIARDDRAGAIPSCPQPGQEAADRAEARYFVRYDPDPWRLGSGRGSRLSGRPCPPFLDRSDVLSARDGDEDLVKIRFDLGQDVLEQRPPFDIERRLVRFHAAAPATGEHDRRHGLPAATDLPLHPAHHMFSARRISRIQERGHILDVSPYST